MEDLKQNCYGYETNIIIKSFVNCNRDYIIRFVNSFDLVLIQITKVFPKKIKKKKISKIKKKENP